MSRLTLADELGDRFDVVAEASFHHDTEPSLVQGKPVFHHLTHGFDLIGSSGVQFCRLVDDMTIRDDLNHKAAPIAGSFRVLSDEPRLLRMIARLGDPTASTDRILEPVATLYRTSVDRLDGGRFRLDDASGATIAMVAPQGGERERVCEIVTPPLVHNHESCLNDLLTPALSLGFTVPSEAAVHVHLDASPFRSAPMLRRLVQLFAVDRDRLWEELGTNSRCRRLGALPDQLVAGVEEAGFDARPWPEVAAWLRTLPLTKFSDCNLTNLVAKKPKTDTVEIRILPGSIDAAEILADVDFVAALFGETV